MRLALPHPNFIRPLRSQTHGDMRMMWHPSTSVGVVGVEAWGVIRLPRKGFPAKTALHALALDMLTLTDVGGHDGRIYHGHGADLHRYAVEVAHIRKQRLRPCRTAVTSLYTRSQQTVAVVVDKNFCPIHSLRWHLFDSLLEYTFSPCTLAGTESGRLRAPEIDDAIFYGKDRCVIAHNS